MQIFNSEGKITGTIYQALLVGSPLFEIFKPRLNVFLKYAVVQTPIIELYTGITGSNSMVCAMSEVRVWSFLDLVYESMISLIMNLALLAFKVVNGKGPWYI